MALSARPSILVARNWADWHSHIGIDLLSNFLGKLTFLQVNLLITNNFVSFYYLIYLLITMVTFAGGLIHHLVIIVDVRLATLVWAVHFPLRLNLVVIVLSFIGIEECKIYVTLY